MNSTFLTADTHFGHRAMAATGKGWRPFATIEEHDETLIENWNRVVKTDDIVWHLGDVGMGPELEILEKVARLNGRKHLIAGNHDAVWSGFRDGYKHQALWLRYFDSVQSFARRKISRSEYFMLNHFPYVGDHTEQSRYDEYRLRDTGMLLAHGHVHDLFAQRGRQVNVGVDVREFRPMHLDELVTAFRAERSDESDERRETA